MGSLLDEAEDGLADLKVVDITAREAMVKTRRYLI